MDIHALYENHAKQCEKMKKFFAEHKDSAVMISMKDSETPKKMERFSTAMSANIDRWGRIGIDYEIGNHGGHKIDGGLGFLNNSYHENFISAIRVGFKNDVASLLREGADIKGGYLIPQEMDEQIVTKLTQENVMRKLATVITTQSKHKIPVLASQPSASWIAEGQEIPLKDENFSQIELDSHKLAAGTKISNELLADSYYNLENFFVEEFGKSLAAAEEDSFINGGADSDTSNRPTGILTTILSSADSDSSIVKTSSTNLFGVDDLIDLVYSLPRAYRQNASWLMHDGYLQKIRLQKSDYQYFWQPSVIEGEPSKLLGFNVYTSAYMPSPPTTQNAAGKPIALFGDFSRYYIADRGQRVFKPLYELFAISDLSAFLMIERVDGKLIDKGAMRLLKYKAS